MDRGKAIRLIGGTVAYNEERRIVRSLHSLLDQELPTGVRWEAIWVVASGCTDRTAELACGVDPRVRVVEQATRTGKASALREVFRQAAGGGDYLVLLNGDAQAEPGSVAQLLETARGVTPPFAVMGRPIPPLDRTGGFTESIRLLWEIHHRFHEFMIQQGCSTNLSDELLLLPLEALPPLPENVVNDGGFVGAWLRTVGGCPLYASGALVTIEATRRFRDHATQRRRIIWGLQQVEEEVGVTPTTLSGYALQNPRQAFRLLWETVRHRRHGWRSLSALVAAELVAQSLARWDRVPPRRDHRVWETIPEWRTAGEHRSTRADRISGIQR